MRTSGWTTDLLAGGWWRPTASKVRTTRWMDIAPDTPRVIEPILCPRCTNGPAMLDDRNVYAPAATCSYLRAF